MFLTYDCNDEAGLDLMPLKRQRLKSVLLGITGTSTLVLRRSDVEAVTQGELDATGVVVLHLLEHHAITIEREAVDATIEEIIACQLDVKPSLKEVLANAKRQHRISAVEPDILLIAISVQVEVGLQQPVVGQRNDVA